MEKPSERISKKQQAFIEEHNKIGTDTLAGPFLSLYDRKTLAWIIEELDELASNN